MATDEDRNDHDRRMSIESRSASYCDPEPLADDSSFFMLDALQMQAMQIQMSTGSAHIPKSIVMISPTVASKSLTTQGQQCEGS